MKMLLDDTLLDGSVSFREVDPGSWLVTVDGDTRVITQEGPGRFIAWIGHQSQQWCFDYALKACVEDARWQRAMPQAFERHMDREALLREQQRLQFSDADNASARLAEVNARLETM